MERLRGKLTEAIELEDLWFSFDTGEFITDDQLRSLISKSQLRPENVSSRPDLFPVYGNMKKAVQTLAMMVGEEPKSDEYECHPGVRGFSNDGNSSCFMDSTLMAMFFLQESPFYIGLLKMPQSGEGKQCSQDPKENLRLKNEVQAIMKDNVDHILSGAKAFSCVKLRNIIGKTCQGSGRDLSNRMQDASELYERVMSIFDYKPLRTRQVLSRSENEYGPFDNPEIRGIENSIYLPISLDDTKFIKWPESWTGLVQNEISKEWVQTETRIVSADVMVVYINRRTDVESGETQYRTDRLKVDETFEVTLEGGEVKKFNLMAVVYPPYAGHYASILKCGGEWKKYDDTMVALPYDRTKLTKSEIDSIIMTKGILLFYY